MAMKVVRQARLELSGGSTPDQLRPLLCLRLRSTAGLMAGIVYGGDIQSIGTDH